MRKLLFLLLSSIALAQSGSQITISIASPSIVTVSLPNVSQGVAYAQSLGGTGGVSPYRFTQVSGSFPFGLVLNGTTGVVSGTCVAATCGTGTYTVTFVVADAVGGISSPVSLSMLVISGGQTLVIDTTSPLPAGVVNVAYTPVALSAHGGSGTGFLWDISAGSLCTGLVGLTGTSSSTISGTPTTVQTCTFTARVTDSAVNVATKSLSITINPGSSACGPPTYPCSVTDASPHAPTGNTVPNFGTVAGRNGGPLGSGMVAFDTGFPAGKNEKQLRLSDFSDSRNVRAFSGGGHNVFSVRQPNGRIYVAAACYNGNPCMYSFDEDAFTAAGAGQGTFSRNEYVGASYFGESVNWPRSAGGAAITFAALTGLVSPPDGSLYNCSNCTVASPTAGGGAGAVVYRTGGIWVGNPTTPSYSFYAMYTGGTIKFGRFTIDPNAHTVARDVSFNPPDPNGALCLNGAGTSYQNNFINNTETRFSAQLTPQDTGYIGTVVDMTLGCRTYRTDTMQISNGWNNASLKDFVYDSIAKAALQRTITSRSRTSNVATVVFSANVGSAWIADSFCRANIQGVSDATFNARGQTCSTITSNSVSYPNTGANVSSTASGGTFTLGEALHDSGMDKTGRYIGLGLKHSPVNGAGAQLDLNTDTLSGCPTNLGVPVCANHQDGAFGGDFSQKNSGTPWTTGFLHSEDKTLFDFCTSFGEFPPMQNHLSGNSSESALDRKFFIMSSFPSPMYPDPANTTKEFVGELLGHDCVTGLIHQFGHNWLSNADNANLGSQGVCQDDVLGKYAVCSSDFQAYKDADGASMIGRGFGDGAGNTTCNPAHDASNSGQIDGCRIDIILHKLQ